MLTVMFRKLYHLGNRPNACLHVQKSHTALALKSAIVVEIYCWIYKKASFYKLCSSKKRAEKE